MNREQQLEKWMKDPEIVRAFRNSGLRVQRVESGIEIRSVLGPRHITFWMSLVLVAIGMLIVHMALTSTLQHSPASAAFLSLFALAAASLGVAMIWQGRTDYLIITEGHFQGKVNFSTFQIAIPKTGNTRLVKSYMELDNLNGRKLVQGYYSFRDHMHVGSLFPRKTQWSGVQIKAKNRVFPLLVLPNVARNADDHRRCGAHLKKMLDEIMRELEVQNHAPIKPI